MLGSHARRTAADLLSFVRIEDGVEERADNRGQDEDRADEREDDDGMRMELTTGMSLKKG